MGFVNGIKSLNIAPGFVERYIADYFLDLISVEGGDSFGICAVPAAVPLTLFFL